ncbi:MAG: hypothetical protein N3E37_00330 [Candidatus Micrarchaeota archaeon]|nr:hypothetical protein [Candidatus Micrarchaeota archaeon]
MRETIGLVTMTIGFVSLLMGLTYLPTTISALMTGNVFIPHAVGFAVFLGFGVLMLGVAFFSLRKESDES